MNKATWTGHRHVTRSTSTRRFGGDGGIELFLFLLPFSLLVEFDVVGKLFLTDLITIGIFPFIFILGRQQADPTFRRVVLLLSVWFIAQILSDLLSGTSTSDLLRGWSMLGLTLMNIMLLNTIVADSTRRTRALLAGLGGAILLGAAFRHFSSNLELFWKFGGVFGLATLLVAYFSAATSSRYRASVILLIILGLVALYYSSRSAALLCISSALILLMSKNSQKARRKQSLGAVILMVGVGLIGGAMVFEVYSTSVMSGILGQEAQQKFLNQSGDRGPLALLICGRLEWAASFYAIMDNPLLGHGSWAKDISYRHEMENILINYHCASNEYLNVGDDSIPSHSFLFGSWVAAGVAGGIFWAYIFITLMKFITLVYYKKDILSPVLCFLAVALTWDIFFSPFGSTRRFIVAAIIVSIVQAIRRYKYTQAS